MSKSATRLDHLPSEVLLRIFSFLSITTLQSVSLTNTTLNHLTKFPQLYRTIQLSKCHLAKSSLPKSISTPLTVCQKFVLKSPESMSRFSFTAILNSLKESPNLESIRVTGVTSFDEQWGVFFEQCKGQEGLKEVVLSRCSISSEPILKLLGNHGGGLTKLSLKFSDVEDVVLDKIIELSAYPSLSPAVSYSPPASAKSTPSTPSLASNSPKFSSTAKSPSADLEGEEKEIKRPRDDRTRGQNNLKELCLAGCFNITQDGLSRLFSSRPAVRNIQKIDLRWNDEISTAWFRNPDMFPNLRELDLRGCGGVTGQNVRDLRRKWGNRLVLRETALDDESIMSAGWKGCLEACESNKWASTRLCPL